MSSDVEQNSGLMSAWKLHDYNGITSVKLVENLPIPKISKATDVLIEVRAASVNVLDVMMAGNQTFFL
jgi:NADPH:quinone reductase-like Zn-dependent oxidoreductase